MVGGLLFINLSFPTRRWGQLVYTTTQHNKGWDGTIHGARQHPGTFVYMVSGIDYTGKVITKKGAFTLMR